MKCHVITVVIDPVNGSAKLTCRFVKNKQSIDFATETPRSNVAGGPSIASDPLNVAIEALAEELELAINRSLMT